LEYLFAGPGEGLIGRALPEALLSTESPLVPRLADRYAGHTNWFFRINGLSIGMVGFAFRGLLPAHRIFLSRISNFGLVRSSLLRAESGGFISYGVDNFMTIDFFI